MSKYVIRELDDGRMVFTLEGDEQVLLTSEPYDTMSECLLGIESARECCRNYSDYIRNLSFNLKFYFMLSDTTGTVQTTSGLFDSAINMGQVLEHVRRMGLTSVVEDLS